MIENVRFSISNFSDSPSNSPVIFCADKDAFEYITNTSSLPVCILCRACRLCDSTICMILCEWSICMMRIGECMRQNDGDTRSHLTVIKLELREIAKFFFLSSYRLSWNMAAKLRPVSHGDTCIVWDIVNIPCIPMEALTQWIMKRYSIAILILCIPRTSAADNTFRTKLADQKTIDADDP